MEGAVEKVFVVLPAEFKAGQSTLSWVLDHFGASRTTVVITHVHVPPQMIPVMGVKFHSGKLSPQQVKLFRRIEHEKVDKQLDNYVHQCSKMKVKCEKLVFEKKDIVAGLVELIALHKVTKLVISAAADRQYSRKMDKPKSRTAIEIMQRADPSCKIWCVCKGQLIYTRGKEEEIAPSAAPDFDHQALQLVPRQKEDDVVESELGLYDELKEACIAAENLMKRALNESTRRQKADGEVASALQKAKECQELYLEEARKREELEGALARAQVEIARLRQANQAPVAVGEQNTAKDELQEAMSSETSSLEGHIVDVEAVLRTAAAGHATEQQQEEQQFDLGTGERDLKLELELELEALLNQSKLAAFSPSSVIQSPYDEDCVPSYFLCPILQEPMRDPHVAADGFTYEGDAIRGWLDGGNGASPVTGQPLAHRELAPNLALAAMIQDYYALTKRRQYPATDSRGDAVAALEFFPSPVGLWAVTCA